MTKTERIWFYICLFGGCLLMVVNTAALNNWLVLIAGMGLMVVAIVIYAKGKKRDKQDSAQTAQAKRKKELEAQRNASYSQIRARKKAEKAQKDEKNQ